ncbi:MAG TPA: tRNA (adenosine(37)-N6)-dimethylallyltransferase MiaA [Candidatus Limnocylindrales bacterium]
MPTPTLALLGPTASGKSTLAVRLALHLRDQGRPAEVVNADSMLVYRGMDIGTAKPTLEERAGVPHHLIDILDVRETATVADFQRLARAAIASCRERDVLPIVVGGSALYLRAILDEFTFPGTDPEVRAGLEAELADVGSAALYERLARLSPEAAAGIEPMNGRRVVRALEVIALTGAYRSTLPEHRYALPGVVQIGLRLDRPTMDARIDARVDDMWRRGLVAEVSSLAERGLREGRTASRALGYQQVLAYLDGVCTEEQARRDTASGTRRFARKQLGWWRRDPRITWVDALDLPAPADLIALGESRL